MSEVLRLGTARENGINKKDADRGLGFTREMNGVEYVRWERVDGYIKEFGFLPLVAKPDLIPGWVFYRLAMKANADGRQLTNI